MKAIGIFASFVGLAQMWLYESNDPRAASLLGGPFALAIVKWWPISQATDSIIGATFGRICIGLLFGSIAGYLDAVVAGVFLPAVKFRMNTMKTSGIDSQEASLMNSVTITPFEHW